MYLAEINKDTKKVIRVLISEDGEWPEWAASTDETFWLETFADVEGERFAAVDDTYIADHGYFVGFQPYSSWVLDHEKKTWVAPVAHPDPENPSDYYWVEDMSTWAKIYKED